MLEVLYHHAKFGGARISHAAGVAKNVEFLFLSVCLSVCPSHFWTSEFVRPISPWRRWSTETILMPLDRGRFVVVHLCSTFSDCCQLATRDDWKCETWNNGTVKNAEEGIARKETAAPKCMGGNWEKRKQRHNVAGVGKCRTGLYGQPKEHFVRL